jgi:hypothetical protein
MNVTPIQINDDARRQQARKEREQAAYLRRKADESDRIAEFLEGLADPDGTAADGDLPTASGVEKVARRFAPVPEAA